MYEASTEATVSGVPAATIRPPRSPPSGAQVDDPVGGPDHFQVVLDDQDAAAVVDQPLEGVEQLGDVVEVQAGGGLVEDEQRALAGRLAPGAPASFTRCASPPDSVVADWPSRR